MLSDIRKNNQIVVVIRHFFKSEYNTTVILDVTGPKPTQFTVQLVCFKRRIKGFIGKLFKDIKNLFLQPRIVSGCLFKTPAKPLDQAIRRIILPKGLF